MMRAATMFSGIGAPEYAMPGWQWLWAAEIERFPSAVLAARHPGSINLGDVSAPDFVERARSVGCPDTLVFGSPCQSFSIAGKRGGLDDPRGDLALIALGVVGQLRPRWFVFENVPGLLSDDDGRSFGVLLGIMGQLGYGFAYRVLDAQYFGVAQQRRRVFVVGHLGDWRRAAAVLFEPASLRRHPAPRREAGERAAGTIEASLGRRCGQPNDDNPAGGLISYALNAKGGMGRIDAESETFVARPLRAQAQASHRDDSDTYVAHALRAEGFDASEDGTGRGTPLVPAVAGTLGRTHGNVRADEAWTGRLISGEPQCGVRRLTPGECESLQGFPRGYTAIAYRGKPAADGPRYRALGNSMAVPVMRWILGRLGRVDAATAANDARMNSTPVLRAMGRRASGMAGGGPGIQGPAVAQPSRREA